MLISALLKCSNFTTNFTIENKIGSGNMGDVFLANDNRLDRKVAIKHLKLPYETPKENEEFILRFKREAKAIARLTHPNIVSIFDVGEENNQHYMVMEYVIGNNLEKIIKTIKEINLDLILSIAIQSCNALEYAHENNVIHRDIKPANIILTDKNIVKVTDFGIARLDSVEEKKITLAGDILGSIAYISPEQLFNASQVDSRTDIYSLGITLYELITGQLPFLPDNIAVFVSKIMSEIPVSPYKINSKIPKELSDIIDKSINKKPEERFENITEMKLELTNLLDKKSLFNIPTPISFGEKKLHTEENKALKDSNLLKRTLIKKTLSTTMTTNTNEKLINSLSSSNYLWLNLLISKLKTIETNYTVGELQEKLITPDINGDYFSGIVVINDEIYLFVYEGLFIGALNTKNNTIGEKVFEHLPVFNTRIILKPTPEENKELSIFISNILNLDGEKIQENIDSSAIDILSIIDELIIDKKDFTGYITCRKFSEFIKSKALIIGKENDAKRIRDYLGSKLENCELNILNSLLEMEKQLNSNEYDFVITDYRLENNDKISFKNISKPIYYYLCDTNNPEYTPNENNKFNLNRKDEYKRLISSINDALLNNISEHEIKITESSYIFGFSNGKNIFSFALGEHFLPKLIEEPITSLLETGTFLVNIYKPKFSLMDRNLEQLLRASKIFVDYKESKEVKLSDTLYFKEKEIPTFLVSTINENIDLKYKPNYPKKFILANEEIDLSSKISESNIYNFLKWFSTDFYFSMNTSNTINFFKNIYYNIPNIKYFEFYKNLKGEDERDYSFTSLAYDENDNLLFLIRFGDDLDIDMENFILDCSLVKRASLNKKTKGFYGAFYISKSFSHDVVNIYEKNTKTVGILNKEKNVVKVSSESYQLFLVKENIEIKGKDSFSLVSFD